MKTPEFEIDRLHPDEPGVSELIAASDRFYAGLYPAESNHLESGDDLRRDNVVFVGCRVDGRPVASGAAKIMRDDGVYAEIKRVFVLDEYRGLGLSKRIMRHLEDELAGRGIDLYRLETGVRQPQALGLYRKLGYRERGPFGAYRADPLSVFMEKRVQAKPGTVN